MSTKSSLKRSARGVHEGRARRVPHHPFYERAEQVAKLRPALKDIPIQPPSPEENLR